MLMALQSQVPLTLPQGGDGELPILHGVDLPPYAGNPPNGAPHAVNDNIRAAAVPPGWNTTHYYNAISQTFVNLQGDEDHALQLPIPRAMSGQSAAKNGAGFRGNRTENALLASSSATDENGNDYHGIEWHDARFPLPAGAADGYVPATSEDAYGHRDGNVVRVRHNAGNRGEESRYRTILRQRVLSEPMRTQDVVTAYNTLSGALAPPFPTTAAEAAAGNMNLNTLIQAWVSVQAMYDRDSAVHYQLYRSEYQAMDAGALGIGIGGHVHHGNFNTRLIDRQLNKLWHAANQARATFIRPANAPLVPGQHPTQRFASHAPGQAAGMGRRGTTHVITRALNAREMWDLWQIVVSLSDTLAAHYNAHLNAGDPMPWMNFPGLMLSLQGYDVPFVDPARILAGQPSLIPNPHQGAGGDNRPLVGADVHPRFRGAHHRGQPPHLRRHRTHRHPRDVYDFNGQSRGHVPGPPYLTPMEIVFE